MIDVMTNKPLRVFDGGTAGAFMIVAVSQLDDIQQILDRHGIRYWVDEDEISMDGEPYTTDIHFGRNSDAHAIQAILDRDGSGCE